MRKKTLLLLLIVASGCQAGGREKVEPLRTAERQFATIEDLQGEERDPGADLGGDCSPLAVFGGVPLFAAAELAQLLSWPVYWGQQDHIVEASVQRYRALCGESAPREWPRGDVAK